MASFGMMVSGILTEFIGQVKMKNFKKFYLIIISAVLFFQTSTIFALSKTEKLSNSTHLSYQTNSFIDHMVKKHHYDRNKLEYYFKTVQYEKKIIELITRPSEKKPWSIYRSIFITKERISQGVQYWKTHRSILQLAAKLYKIPASIIVAIIGVETYYGRVKGNFPVFNALATLAFKYKPRSQFFKSELEQFLLLIREHNLSIHSLKGSYAGAIGIPQFMPSSYRKYAVSFNKNKKSNLIDSDNDAILSIAHYLKAHGWHPNKPIASEVCYKKPIQDSLISRTAKPHLSLKALAAHAIYSRIPLPLNERAALVRLEKNHTNHEYWALFHNFSVIMSYNPRIYYAMAVYQLSTEIQAAMKK